MRKSIRRRTSSWLIVALVAANLTGLQAGTAYGAQQVVGSGDLLVAANTTEWEWYGYTGSTYNPDDVKSRGETEGGRINCESHLFINGVTGGVSKRAWRY